MIIKEHSRKSFCRRPRKNGVDKGTLWKRCPLEAGVFNMIEYINKRFINQRRI
jgi:hypothetical protein